MNRKSNEPITGYIAYGVIGLCLVMLLSLFWNMAPRDISKAAQRMEKTVSHKMARLEKAAMEPGQARLDDDMVIYRYSHDSLVHWNNQFPIKNDDIRDPYVLPALTNPQLNIVSPLSKATDEARLMELGPRSYIIKATKNEDVSVIMGLEMPEEYVEGSGIHIRPLSWFGGAAVNVEGRPCFKLIKENIGDNRGLDPSRIMPLLIMLLTSILLLLVSHRSWKSLAFSIGGILVSIGALYLWGKTRQYQSGLFSPILFADGNFLYSLGAVILVNLAITLCVTCTYIMRRPLLRWETNLPTSYKNLWAAGTILVIAGIFLYVFHTFKSICLNSSICLELYKINELSWHSLLVYVSFCLLILTVPLLIQLLRPAAMKMFRMRLELYSVAFRIGFSLICAALLVLIAVVSGFKKEQSTQELWAYRLSMERNVAMEMHLRSVEQAISDDVFLGALSALNNIERTIASRIEESYFAKEAQDYDMKVFILNDGNAHSPEAAYVSGKMREGTPIEEGSRFHYSTSSNAVVTYFGLFHYFNKGVGVSTIAIEITPKTNLQDKGFANIFGLTTPGKVSVPPKYSYARYDGNSLSYFKGSFAYPTIVHRSLEGVFKERSYTHFVTNVSNDTAIILSRKSTSFFEYILSVLFLAIGMYLFISIFIIGRNQRPLFLVSNYYRSKASQILIISLVATLVVMAFVSIIFVYERNESNMQSSMSEKVTTIQTLFAEECSECGSLNELDSPGFLSLMRMVSDMAKTDISIYSTDGKIFRTTIPEVFDRMLIGSRLSQEALDGIVSRNQLYCIKNEKANGKSFYALYAPLFNGHGDMIAIIGAPYSDTEYDFRTEAIIHLIAIILVFAILLIIARIAIESVIDRLFKPLVEMGKKMEKSNLEKLEYIDYTRDDEISSLVGAYNRMVHDLSESSQRLAQAERDRAWSDMARQVAHEIKNPLTPMKLQIQRLIRLKDKNDPEWQNKFDECTRIVLDHIDILSDTANEFSTFAKLYSEDPTLIDLNLLIEEEITMFDNKDYIEIVYVGLNGASIMGPKPQLTRVVVNLISNSIQAIDILRSENAEGGKEAPKGRIFISVRNSSSDDNAYDIVFEDNGPGVSIENQNRLFTPNFTTKSSGTGLGLAICKNILEKCGARISYSKSFSLGGACFTIVYPKTYSTSDGCKAE